MQVEYRMNCSLTSRVKDSVGKGTTCKICGSKIHRVERMSSCIMYGLNDLGGYTEQVTSI